MKTESQEELIGKALKAVKKFKMALVMIKSEAV